MERVEAVQESAPRAGPSTRVPLRLGGTAAGLAAAQAKSWREIVAFLDHSLRGR